MSALPLTYPDLVCDLDLDPLATETTSDLAGLIQDVTHLLIELPGTNPDDPLRGIGVELYLSGTADQLSSLPSRIEAQLSEDDRIDGCTCTASLEADGSYLLTVGLAVGASVLSLEYGWSQSAGLVLQSQQ